MAHLDIEDNNLESKTYVLECKRGYRSPVAMVYCSGLLVLFTILRLHQPVPTSTFPGAVLTTAVSSNNMALAAKDAKIADLEKALTNTTDARSLHTKSQNFSSLFRRGEELYQAIHKGAMNPNLNLIDTQANWTDFQSDLVGLAERSDHRRLHTLVLTAVSNQRRVAKNWEANYKKLQTRRSDDIIHFVFFHYDTKEPSEWRNMKWYNGADVRLKLHQVGGCKPHFFHQVHPELTEQYDYVWLMDEDISLAYFSWDLYRAHLLLAKPIVSRPALLPAVVNGTVGDHNEDITSLLVEGNMMLGKEKMDGKKGWHDGFIENSLVVLHAAIWRVMHQRLKSWDLLYDWGLDNLWSTMAVLARDQCGMTGGFLVPSSPAVHLDFKTISGEQPTVNSTEYEDRLKGSLAGLLKPSEFQNSTRKKMNPCRIGFGKSGLNLKSLKECPDTKSVIMHMFKQDFNCQLPVEAIDAMPLWPKFANPRGALSLELKTSGENVLFVRETWKTKRLRRERTVKTDIKEKLMRLKQTKLKRLKQRGKGKKLKREPYQNISESVVHQ